MSEVNEIKSLTLGGKKYDSFPDQTARAAAAGKLPSPATAKVGDYLVVEEVDAEGKITKVKTAEAPGGGSDSGQNPTVATVEPAEDDIPKVFFGGALQQTKDEKVVSFRYISKTQDISGYAEIKAQGNSSMSYPKKNQTVKLYKDAECTEKLKVDFKGWGKQSKHCYKANWIDLSHSRNVVSARLWGDIVKSRADYAELPELLRTSPNQGAVDGFPIKVYAAGVYQGRYTINIPKDAWMANMDKDNEAHCILCGENYVSGCFRAAAKIDESDWTDEIHDTVPASIKTRWNEAISFVMTSTDDDFKANLGQYFDIPSLLDYHLFGLQSCGLDAYGKNQIYMTYDGQKWIAQMYDMDSTWGLYWNGASFVTATYSRESYEDWKNGGGNLLYIRLEQCFHEELQARWAELKNGALSMENIINRFERFTDVAPAELIREDYASTTGGGKFTGIPSQSANNIQQIRAFALARQAWVDEYVAGLTPEEKVPCTGITLDESELLFTEAGTQTLTATVEPENTTDIVRWSSDNSTVASVNGGIVTAGANGSAVITATCGNMTATCNVSVSGIEEGGGENGVLYSLPGPKTFNGTSDYIDTGVKLFDTAKDFTIVLDADLAATNQTSATIFHCIQEATPFPGVQFRYQYGTYYVLGGNTNKGYVANQDAAECHITPTGRTKVVVTFAAGMAQKMKYRIADDDITDIAITDTDYEAHDTNLVVGAYRIANGALGRFWGGAMYDFKVYNYAMTDEEITTYLNG